MSDFGATSPVNPYGDLSRRARRELEAKGINPDEALAAYNATGNIEALTGAIPIVVVPSTVEEAPVDEPVVEAVIETVAVEEIAVDEIPVEEVTVVEGATEVVAEDKAVTSEVSSSIFPPFMSRREKAILEQRRTAEVDIIFDALPEPDDLPEPEAFPEPVSPAADLAPEADNAEHEVLLEDVSSGSELETDTDSGSVTEADAEVSDEDLEESGSEDDGVTNDLADLIAIVERDAEDIDDTDDDLSQAVEPVSFDGGPLSSIDDGIAIDLHEDTESTVSEYESFQIMTTSTGIIPTTGHTLILPTLPEDDPNVVASFSQMGEIVITGQITLPASISAIPSESTHPDTADIDTSADIELVAPSTDLAPVSASQAVSTFSAPGTVSSPIKRRSEKLPVILAVSVAILALGVVGLFVANFFLKVF